MFVELFMSALPLLAAAAPAPAKPARTGLSTPAGWAKICKPWDDWSKPAPPFRIDANSYYVGTCGITAVLITGDKGAVLIDGGPADAGGLIARNIAAAGVKLNDVKILLHTHEHSDHIGGLAELRRLTGARLLASPEAAKALERGGPSPNDPQFAEHMTFPKVTVDGTLHDGQTIRLGNLALTAHATPGHTAGALSWSWRSCKGGKCRNIVYADSLSPVGSDSYRFSDHPAYLATYRRSIAKLAALPCDILLTAHPSQSEMVRRAATGALAGGMSCKARAADLSKALDARLAREKR